MKTQIENAWNLEFHGVKMAITHFEMELTQVSRHFLVKSKKTNKNTYGKLFWKSGLKFMKEMVYVSTKLLLAQKKVQKLRKIKTKNHESVHNLWRILGTKIDFWDHIFKTVFLKHIFCFLFYTSKCLEICVNCVTKCVTAKIYPMKVQILETTFV